MIETIIIIMVIGIRQYLSNTWRSIHEKLSNTEAELKKSVAYIKKIVTILIIATFTGAVLIRVMRLLEEDAYFNVDTQRCGAYLRPGVY